MSKLGPTLSEMREPWTIDPSMRAEALAARRADPLEPVNLYNITWYDDEDEICHFVVPPEVTGVEAPIVTILQQGLPHRKPQGRRDLLGARGAHRRGRDRPRPPQLVWPSTGNYGVGGAWVGGRMGCESLVVLPEGMSRERFELIEGYGAEVVKTPGASPTSRRSTTRRASSDRIRTYAS